MNIIEKLEKYFNSGSTDKQNKRRLGGLLIAVTAMLLAVSIVAVAVGGIVVGIIGLIGGSSTPDEDVDSGVNTHLAEVALSDVVAKAEANKLFTLTNAELSLADADYTKLQPVNRPKNENGNNLYMCENSNDFALQKDAFDAFNELMRAFYDKTKNLDVWVKAAYNANGGNTSYYTNGLAVKLDYLTNSDDEAAMEKADYITATTYGVKDYEWIYDNAYKYGFVRVSGAEGEENIFRYVGLAHAKYIQSKQSKKGDTFYSLDSYIAEVKASTPDTPIRISSVNKAVGATGTTSYNVYFMPADSAVFKLPTEKYSYTVMAIDGGYIVTYCKAEAK